MVKDAAPVLVAALLAALLLAGCTGPNAPIENQPTVLSGAFTADRTESDLDDFGATLARHDVDCPLMESFPEQFSCRMPLARCQDLRADLVEKEYLGHLSGCAAQ